MIRFCLLVLLLALMPGCTSRGEESGLSYPDGLFPVGAALYVQKGAALYRWDFDSGQAIETFRLPTDVPLVVWQDTLYGSDGHDLLRWVESNGKLEMEAVKTGYSQLELWGQEGPYLLAAARRKGEEAVPTVFTLSTGEAMEIDLPFPLKRPLVCSGLGDGFSLLCHWDGIIYQIDLAAGTCEPVQRGWLYTAARLGPWLYMVSAPEQDFQQARLYRYDPVSGQKEDVLETHPFQNAPNRMVAMGDQALLLVTDRGAGSELGCLAADGTYTVIEVWEEDRLWDLACTEEAVYVFRYRLEKPEDFVIQRLPLEGND